MGKPCKQAKWNKADTKSKNILFHLYTLYKIGK